MPHVRASAAGTSPWHSGRSVPVIVTASFPDAATGRPNTSPVFEHDHHIGARHARPLRDPLQGLPGPRHRDLRPTYSECDPGGDHRGRQARHKVVTSTPAWFIPVTGTFRLGSTPSTPGPPLRRAQQAGGPAARPGAGLVGQTRARSTRPCRKGPSPTVTTEGRRRRSPAGTAIVSRWCQHCLTPRPASTPHAPPAAAGLSCNPAAEAAPDVRRGGIAGLLSAWHDGFYGVDADSMSC